MSRAAFVSRWFAKTSPPESHGGNYPAGGGFYGGDDDDDFRQAKDEAAHRSGGNSDLFSNILSSIGQKKQQIHEEDLDEEGMYCDNSRLSW